MTDRFGVQGRAARALIGVSAAWLAATALPAHAANDVAGATLMQAVTLTFH